MNTELDTQRIAARGERQANVLPRLLRSLLLRFETPLLLTEALPPLPAPANDDGPAHSPN
jgi:hypothetical protein